ncbi:hypothetical protein LZ31DRAFT_290 [Colletotrichum somersetense]|nr:hypothetical protein LZ31DRAFT_290 [Colletotrichum somersetense]
MFPRWTMRPSRHGPADGPPSAKLLSWLKTSSLARPSSCSLVHLQTIPEEQLSLVLQRFDVVGRLPDARPWWARSTADGHRCGAHAHHGQYTRAWPPPPHAHPVSHTRPEPLPGDGGGRRCSVTSAGQGPARENEMFSMRWHFCGDPSKRNSICVSPIPFRGSGPYLVSLTSAQPGSGTPPPQKPVHANSSLVASHDGALVADPLSSRG